MVLLSIQRTILITKAGPSLGFENCRCRFPTLPKESPVFTYNEGFKVLKPVGVEHPLHPH